MIFRSKIMELMGDIILFVLGACGAVLAGMILYGLFWLMDNAFTSHQRTTGEVAAIEFYPEHQETYFNVALKMPQTRTVPDQWSILLETSVGKGWLDVGEAPGKWFARGKTVEVEYARGRITQGFRVLNISKP